MRVIWRLAWSYSSNWTESKCSYRHEVGPVRGWFSNVNAIYFRPRPRLRKCILWSGHRLITTVHVSCGLNVCKNFWKDLARCQVKIWEILILEPVWLRPILMIRPYTWCNKTELPYLNFSLVLFWLKMGLKIEWMVHRLKHVTIDWKQYLNALLPPLFIRVKIGSILELASNGKGSLVNTTPLYLRRVENIWFFARQSR